MYGPVRNGFVFPRVLMFPETKWRETELEGNKTIFPRDHTLNALFYI